MPRPDRASDHRAAARTFSGIPIGDLERIRDLNRRCAGWVDEWDIIRDAVRRRLDELYGRAYPTA